MMKRLLMMVIVLLLALVVPVAAQGDTVPADGVQANLVQLIIGLLTAFAAGGIVGIAGLAVFVQRVQNDTATVTAMEKLAASYPPETRELLANIARSVSNIGDLAEEVFDDTPAAAKLGQGAGANSDEPI